MTPSHNNALLLLKVLYEATRVDSRPVDVTKLEITGLGGKEVKPAFDYLKAKSMIRTFAIPYTACINAKGIDTIEQQEGAKEQMKTPTINAAPDTRPAHKIVIGHGRSKVWYQLKVFLNDRLHLPCDEFNAEAAAGLSTTARLEEMLDAAGFAFLVMTAEDIHADDTSHARENVIHEAGLFQGRLGFKRAIILLEEGCAVFSNIHGLTHIGFPKGNLEPAFERIRHVLEREDVRHAVVDKPVVPEKGHVKGEPFIKAEPFLNVDSVTKKIADFRSERITTLAKGIMLAPIAEGPKLVLHCMPLESFGAKQFDVLALDGITPMYPNHLGGYGTRVNFEGSICIASGAPSLAYTQIFRNGAIEAVRAGVLSGSQQQDMIPSFVYEDAVLTYLPHCFDIFKKTGL